MARSVLQVYSYGLYSYGVRMGWLAACCRYIVMVCIAMACGWDGSQRAADAALSEAAATADDVDVAEIHDAFSSSEVPAYGL